MKIKQTAIFFITLSVVVVSCRKYSEKDVQQQVPGSAAQEIPVKMENGYLVFKDLNSFYETLKTVNTFKDNESRFALWESGLGFRSQYSQLMKVRKELDAAGSEPEQRAMINRYAKDFIYNDMFGTFDLKNGQHFISPVLNEKGMVRIGNALIRYKDGATLSTATNYAVLSSTDDARQLENNEAVKTFKGQIPAAAAADARFDVNPYQDANTLTRSHFGEVFTEGDRKFNCQLNEDWTTFPLYDQNNQFIAFTFMWRVYLRFSHQKRGLFGWNQNASHTYVVNIDYTMRGKVYPVFENFLNVGGQQFPASAAAFTAWHGTASKTYSNFWPNTIIFPQQQETFWYLMNSFDNSYTWFVHGLPGGPYNPTYDIPKITAIRDYWNAHGQPAPGFYCPVPEIEFTNFHIDAIGDNFPSGNRLVKNYSFDVPYYLQ
jgi:hypothetical protein